MIRQEYSKQQYKQLINNVTALATVAFTHARLFLLVLYVLVPDNSNPLQTLSAHYFSSLQAPGFGFSDLIKVFNLRTTSFNRNFVRLQTTAHPCTEQSSTTGVCNLKNIIFVN